MSASLVIAPPVSFALAHTPWIVERVARLDEFLRRCERLQQARQGPFQHSTWLRSWYATVIAAHPSVEPLLLAARAEGDPADALLMPLIVRRKGLMAIAEGADLGHGVPCAPLVRDGLQLSGGDLGSLRRALLEALAGVDLLMLDRLPERLAAGPNPWVQLFDTVRADSVSHGLALPDGADIALRLHGPAEGLDLERCWRHFHCAPDARFVRASTADEGLRLLRQLAILQHRQHARATVQAARPPVDIAVHEAFVRDNLASGRAVMTALMSRDEMVAGMCSLFDGRGLTVLRGASGSERWSSCAPRTLLLDRTLRALHPAGCRELDLGVGEAALAEVLGASVRPLRQACVALSLLGQVHALAWKLQRMPRRKDDELAAA